MNSYPDLSKTEPQSRLLFEAGYSYGLLSRVQRLLVQLSQTDKVPKEEIVLITLIQNLMEDIAQFEVSRLSIREIYAYTARVEEQR